MTAINTFDQFVEQVRDYKNLKENPEEWYVLSGQQVTEYSIWADEDLPDDYEQIQAEMPAEDRDANPNVDGYMQIGSAGWFARAFEFEEGDGGFVDAVHFGDTIERNMFNLLVVHESVLSDEALETANNDKPAEVDAK